MKYSSETPLVEGLYWRKMNEKSEPSMWKLKIKDGTMWAYSIEYAMYNLAGSMGGWWYGPVKPPSE